MAEHQLYIRVLMYTPCDRYKFESNSQRWSPRAAGSRGCIRHVIDTGLKAIHNRSALTSDSSLMYVPCDRYKFESNSQPLMHTERVDKHVIDTSLKAIHNLLTLYLSANQDVYAIL